MYFVLCPHCKHPSQVLPEYVQCNALCPECNNQFLIQEEDLFVQDDHPEVVQQHRSSETARPIIEQDQTAPISSMPTRSTSTYLPSYERRNRISTHNRSFLPYIISFCLIVFSALIGVFIAFYTIDDDFKMIQKKDAITTDSELQNLSNMQNKHLSSKVTVVRPLIDFKQDTIATLPGYLAQLIKSQESAFLAERGLTFLDYTQLEQDLKYVHVLFAWQFMNAVGETNLYTFSKKTKAYEFLFEMLNDSDFVEKIALSGGMQNPTRALELAYIIWKYDTQKECFSNPIYENLAVACAMSCWRDNYEVFALYDKYKSNHKRGLLHKNFDSLSAREMRYVAQPEKLQADAIDFLIENHNSFVEKYGGTCWSANYLLNNLFDDSIHGPLYYRPWDYVYTRYQAIRNVGGVCGSLSHYGQAAAKARGVLSITGGQPGHCAYMVRHNDKRWRVHYNVERWTGVHFSLWGEHNFYYLDLIESIFEQVTEHRKSMIALAQAAYLQSLDKNELVFDVKQVLLGKSTARRIPNPVQAEAKPTEKRAFDIFQFGVSEYYSVFWSGDLIVPKTQEYMFTLGADDGAILLIDGNVLIDDDGAHSIAPKTSLLKLTKGKHTFELKYHQLRSGRGLVIKGNPSRYIADAKVIERFKEAVDAQPINFPAWVAYADYIQKVDHYNASDWRNWARKMAMGLNQYQEVAWDLIKRYVDNPVKNKSSVQTLALFYADMYDILKQPDRWLAEGPNITGLLNHQYKMLDKSLDLMLIVYEHAMFSQFGSSQNFPQLANWAGENFINSPTTSKKFIELLAKVTSEKGTEGISSFLKTAILSASRQGDIATFQNLSDLSDKLNKNKNNQKIVTKQFNEPLLSNKGVLQTSGTSGHENPENYRSVISEVGDNNFHTGNDVAPWAKVKLPGDAEISGIYIQNVPGQNSWRSVPLIVSISEDNVNWKEVYRTDESVKNEWRIPLKEKTRARYVKVERPAPKKQFFHLKKILVYGKKLY